MNRSDELHRELETSMSELEVIRDNYGTDVESMPAGQRERHERLVAHVRRVNAELQVESDRERDREAKVARVRELRESGVARPEPAQAPAGPSHRGDPWSVTDLRAESPLGWSARAHDALGIVPGMTDTARQLVAEAVDRRPVDGAAVVALSSPAYRAAFEKYLRNPARFAATLTPQESDAVSLVENVRAALSTSSGSAGYLIPLSLQPMAVVANAGVASAIRSISRHEVAISSPHRAVKSAGVTVEWKSEGAEATQGAPTFTNVDVPLYNLSAWVSASVESIEDAVDLPGQVAGLIRDAVAVAEGTAFTTGSGSGEPTGVVTAVAAVTASRVSPTTGGTFTAATEVYIPHDGLPARARQSRSLAWVAHNSTISKIRQFDTSGGSAYIANLGEATPPRLLGAPIFEASAMDSAVTTGSNLLLVGDFARFLVVDHALGSALEFVPHVVGANGLPTHQRGWLYHGRVGSDVLDASQFRVLQL